MDRYLHSARYVGALIYKMRVEREALRYSMDNRIRAFVVEPRRIDSGLSGLRGRSWRLGATFDRVGKGL